MTHDDALDILTAWITSPGSAGDISPERKATAEEHVACCVDCWQELLDIGTALGAATPGTAERMDALFGCEGIVDQLYKVVGVDVAGIERRFPRVATHLKRCVTCREMLSDLEDACLVEPEPASVAPWRELVLAGGERVLEWVGDLAFRLREGMVVSISAPGGLVVVPVGVAGAVRGGGKRGTTVEEPPVPTEAPGQGFSLELDGIDVAIELLIDSNQTDRARLEVRVLRGERPVSVVLRRVEGDAEHLVAAQDAAPSKKFVASNLQPGAFRLEVRSHPAAVRRRIRLSLERG